MSQSYERISLAARARPIIPSIARRSGRAEHPTRAEAQRCWMNGDDETVASSSLRARAISFHRGRGHRRVCRSHGADTTRRDEGPLALYGD